jgi:Flp pilus assembly secretin CpaC
MVRATADYLIAVEAMVMALTISPPQVVLEVRWAEYLPEVYPALGLDAYFTNHAAASNGTATAILTESQSNDLVRTLENHPGIDLISMPKVTTLSSRQTQIKAVKNRYAGVTIQKAVTEESPANAGSNTASIGPGPESGTTTGDPAAGKPIEADPAIDIVPFVLADGMSIHLSVAPRLREFQGYTTDLNRLPIYDRIKPPNSFPTDPGIPAEPDRGAQNHVVTNPQALTTRTSVPTFRQRSVMSIAAVQDGQTLVMTGGTVLTEQLTKDKVPVLGDLPLAGRFFRHENRQSVRKNVLILVTPTVIDPAGNRVNPPQP